MDKLMAVSGNVAAVLGIALCLLAVGARMMGHYFVGSFEVVTFFTAGMGLMLVACLAKLHLLSRQR